MNVLGTDVVARTAFAALFLALVTSALYANITGQRTDYGTGHGRFADQVDSYSEYIIRNSVMNDVLGDENRYGSLVMTRGYPEGDYAYYAESTRKYYSHQGMQRRIYSWLASALSVDTPGEFALFFEVLRAVNCALLAAGIYMALRMVFARRLTACVGTAVVAVSGGVALFAANLYFMFWLMFAPYYSMVLLRRFGALPYLAAAFVFSFVYFLCHYEFATTLALLWMLPPLLTTSGAAAVRPRQGRVAGAAFALVVTGFVAAAAIHVVSIAQELSISAWEAKDLAFATVAARTTSLQGVPMPFSPQFFRHIAATQNWTGLSIPLVVVIKKLPIVLAWLALGVHQLRKNIRSAHSLVFLVSACAYLSWYLAAYQHIMWHGQYDSLLFSVAVFVPFVIIAGRKLEDLT